jgi:hypothetical protein
MEDEHTLIFLSKISYCVGLSKDEGELKLTGHTLNVVHNASEPVCAFHHHGLPFAPRNFKQEIGANQYLQGIPLQAVSAEIEDLA